MVFVQCRYLERLVGLIFDTECFCVFHRMVGVGRASLAKISLFIFCNEYSL